MPRPIRFLKRFRRWGRREQFEAVVPLSEKIAKWFDETFAINGVTFISANQITFLGLLLCIPGGWSLAIGDTVAGTIWIILSLLTDWFDGSLGRHQEKKYRASMGLEPMTLEEERLLTLWQRFNFKGVTHMGKECDPFVDKARVIVVLVVKAFDIVYAPVIYGIFIMAGVLTIMRPIKQRLKLDHVGSNRGGKYKIYFEIAGMGVLVFCSPYGDTVLYAVTVNALFIIALILAFVSFTIHIISGYFAHRARRRLPAKQLKRATLVGEVPRP